MCASVSARNKLQDPAAASLSTATSADASAIVPDLLPSPSLAGNNAEEVAVGALHGSKAEDGHEPTDSDGSTDDASDASDVLQLEGETCSVPLGQCAADLYCNFVDGTCGAATSGGSRRKLRAGAGICTRLPVGCPRNLNPVCGCDNQTHPNSCVAATRGVSILADGECPRPDLQAVDEKRLLVGGAGLGTLGATEVGATCNPRNATTVCSDAEFCSYNVGVCPTGESPRSAVTNAADQNEPLGSCTTVPTVCTKEYHPVCGCDSKTYGNPCMAAAAGMNIMHFGECRESTHEGACRAASDCAPGQVCLAADGVCNLDPATGGATSGLDGAAGTRDSAVAERSSTDGRGVGECTNRPLVCSDVGTGDEVCGCDGVTYASRCAAQGAGVTVRSTGRCEGDHSGTTDLPTAPTVPAFHVGMKGIDLGAPMMAPTSEAAPPRGEFIKIDPPTFVEPPSMGTLLAPELNGDGTNTGGIMLPQIIPPPSFVLPQAPTVPTVGNVDPPRLQPPTLKLGKAGKVWAVPPTIRRLYDFVLWAEEANVYAFAAPVAAWYSPRLPSEETSTLHVDKATRDQLQQAGGGRVNVRYDVARDTLGGATDGSQSQAIYEMEACLPLNCSASPVVACLKWGTCTQCLPCSGEESIAARRRRRAAAEDEAASAGAVGGSAGGSDNTPATGTDASITTTGSGASVGVVCQATDREEAVACFEDLACAGLIAGAASRCIIDGAVVKCPRCDSTGGAMLVLPQLAPDDGTSDEEEDEDEPSSASTQMVMGVGLVVGVVGLAIAVGTVVAVFMHKRLPRHRRNAKSSAWPRDIYGTGAGANHRAPDEEIGSHEWWDHSAMTKGLAPPSAKGGVNSS